MRALGPMHHACSCPFRASSDRHRSDSDNITKWLWPRLTSMTLHTYQLHINTLIVSSHFFLCHISDIFRALAQSLAHLCSTDLATEERRWEKEERRGRRLLLSFFVPSWSVRGASFLDHTYRGHHQNWPQQPRNRLEGWSRDLSGARRALNSAR